MQIRFIRMIDDLFRGVPHSRKVLELKEEMVQNLMEKFNDLLAQGKSEEAAFEIAAASIGDIGDLVRELRKDDPFYAEGEDETIVIHGMDSIDGMDPEPVYAPPPPTPEEMLRRSATAVSTATMLFIVSPAPLLLFRNRMGVLLLFAMIAAGVGLLVFNRLMNPRAADRQAESLENWEEKPDAERKKLFQSLVSAFWLVVTAVYILYSFETDNWYISWVIFLFAAAVSELLKIVFKPNPKKLYGRVSGAIVLSSVAFYFIISFATDAWHITWVLLPLGVALSNVVKAFLQIKRK
ncbi:MAG: permease prefix domain 1-containing protein [Firmicutes bacterium]|nr:permease prefix domain 1-containing protein [Bacillota bacterium]